MASIEGERRWKADDELLAIREGETVDAEAALIEPHAENWRAVGLTVTRAPTMQPGIWRVRAEPYVGVARLPSRGGRRPQVEIRPKIDADIFFLADYAFRLGHGRVAQKELRVAVSASRRDPAAALIAWFLSEIEAFVIRHLRRDYIVQREVFEGRVRGRLLLSDYFQKFVAGGNSHRAPCQFFEFTRDNLPNQILKSSVRELERLTALVPLVEARKELRSRLDRVLPYLGAVSDKRIILADFNRLRLRASLRHYQPIMEQCQALFERMYMSTQLGIHGQDAFLWSMPSLFQDALAGVLRTTPGTVLERRTGRAVLREPEGQTVRRMSVIPDIVLRTPSGRLLLDAKYKQTGIGVHEPAEEGTVDIEIPTGTRIRIGRNDLYQVVAYGQQERFSPCGSGLVFPICLGPGQALPAPYRITGFAQDVPVLFIDIGEHASANLEAFRTRILDLVTHGTERLTQLAA